MDGQIKKITINPPRRDKEGEITALETATITLSVPMDTVSQQTEVKKLFDILDSEWVKIDITASQMSLPLSVVSDNETDNEVIQEPNNDEPHISCTDEIRAE